MAANSKIQWTRNTFNPWIGCSKVHRGCQFCYAEAFSKRTGKAVWGPDGTRVMSSPSYWQTPLKWNRDAEKAGERHRVFCASLADIFEDWQGPILHHGGERLSRDAPGRYVKHKPNVEGARWATMDDMRSELFKLIDATPHLDWLILTKRPENIQEMWNRVDTRPAGNLQKYRPNVWLLTSVSDQETAERFVPPLLKCKPLAAVIGVSAEPLVGPVDFERMQAPGEREGLCYNALTTNDDSRYFEAPASLDWVIIGGESGGWKTSAPYEIAWAKDIIGQCKRNGVACFHKQLGRVPVIQPSTVEQYRAKTHHEMEWAEGTTFGNPTGKPEWNGRVVILKDDKGGDDSEWPEPLRVREYPQVEHAEV